MTFARRVFLFSAVYGLLVLLPQYFMEARIGRDFPPAITHPEHFYGFIGVALAWQILFFVIAREPAKFRIAMLPAALEKLAFGGAAVALFLQGRLHPVVLAGGVLDLILMVLFLAAFRATRISSTPETLDHRA